MVQRIVRRDPIPGKPGRIRKTHILVCNLPRIRNHRVPRIADTHNPVITRRIVAQHHPLQRKLRGGSLPALHTGVRSIENIQNDMFDLILENLRGAVALIAQIKLKAMGAPAQILRDTARTEEQPQKQKVCHRSLHRGSIFTLEMTDMCRFFEKRPKPIGPNGPGLSLSKISV